MVEGDGTRSFRPPLLFRPSPPQLLNTLQSALEGKAHQQGSKIEPMNTTPIRLILASASPARRKLLEDSRIAFTVRVSSVDEDAALAAANEQARAQGREGLTPAETASLLAQLKAQAVAAELAAEGVRDALVLGCDSVFEFDGVAYGKPHTAEAALERISAMSGNYGVLHTGHALVDLRGQEQVPSCPLLLRCPLFLNCAAPPSTLMSSPPRKSRRTLLPASRSG